jgi:hypothetical protein
MPRESMLVKLRSARVFAAVATVSLSHCGSERVARADGLESREISRVPFDPGKFTIPFELGSSAAWLQRGQGPVYRFSAGVLPGALLWECVGLHGLAQFQYRNPGVDVALGGRVSMIVASLAGGLLPLRAAAESAYFVRGKGVYYAGGFGISFGNLLYLMPFVGYDQERNARFATVRIGFELMSLGDPVGAITRFVPGEVGQVP